MEDIIKKDEWGILFIQFFIISNMREKFSVLSKKRGNLNA